MSVVQHKSIIGTTQNVSLTLDLPVTEGNLLVAVIGCFSNSVNSLEDASQPSFAGWNSVAFAFDNPFDLQVWYALAQTSETYTLQVNLATNNGLAQHLHLFEVSGYDTADQQATNLQTTNAPSVGVSFNTAKAREFVLAAFLDASHGGETFTAGSGYTAGETTNVSFSMFSEYQEISSIGQPSATATMVTPASDQFLSVIVTFYGSGESGGSGGGGSTDTNTFLGSVRVLGSAPSGRSNPFLGTVKVVSSAPSGVPNPYLGSVVIGTPAANNTNPTVGEVVIVESVPAGATDPFLGTVSEG